MDRNDPYLVLLRRELTRAQARLRRCERERDALRAAIVAQLTPAPKPETKQKRPNSRMQPRHVSK
jgi:hypothetical protein